MDTGLREDGRVSPFSPPRLSPGTRDRVGLAWFRVPERDYPRGQYMMTCVLGPSGPIAIRAVPEIGREAGVSTDDEVTLKPTIAFVEDSWRLYLWRLPRGAQSSNEGAIYTARFDELTCEPPRLLLSGVAPLQIWGPFFDGGSAHFFWTARRYIDSAVLFFANRNTLHQIVHFRTRRDKGDPPQVLLERPDMAGESQTRVVRRGPELFDLLFVRGTKGLPVALYPDHVIHVPNLLGSDTDDRKEHVIWKPPAGTSITAVPLQRGWIQLLAGYTSPDTKVMCLSEMHYDGRAWSTARELASSQRWSCPNDGIAVAPVAGARQDFVLAAWRTWDDNHLVFTVGAADTWSEPQETELTVGKSLWLVSVGNRFMLVTQDRDNLFWCWLELERTTK